MSANILEAFKNNQLGKDKPLPNLYSHLGHVFESVILNHQEDGLKHLEKISHTTKKAALPIKDPIPSQDLKATIPQPQDGDWLIKAKAITENPRQRQIQDDGRPRLVEVKRLGRLPDVLKTVSLIEWAGVAIGTDVEVYQLQLSLKHLAARTGAQNLRFWGKIFGSKRDYFIAQGYLGAPSGPGGSKEIERRGDIGANYNTYWVTDNVLEDWVELPDATPQHINQAKEIKHVLTGELNAPVFSFPQFFGKERHLLRAQIARISHSCHIAPKDIYKEKEEEEEREFKDLEISEEAKIPALAQLNSVESWVHIPPYLLKAGRIAHLEPAMPANFPDPAEWNGEEQLQKLKEADPQVEQVRLSPISSEAETPLWQVKLVGDNQPYNNLSGEGSTESYAAVILTNKNWPGSVTVAHFGAYTSVYVGYGLKSGGSSFSPIEPPDVMNDPAEPKEQPEPTPLHEPPPETKPEEETGSNQGD